MADRDGQTVGFGTRKYAVFLAGLALILAVAALLMLGAAGLGSRFGFWHFRTGFAMLGYGGWCGLAATLAGLGAAGLSVRPRRHLCLMTSLLAVIFGIIAFSVPMRWKMTAQRLPRIHDITTDTVNPPRLAALLPLRQNAPNPAEYGGPEIASLQHQAYPDLKTVILEMPAAQAFDRALDAAASMGWHIVAAEQGEGRIEAVDTTFWFGFRDDIVVRITPAGQRSLLDVRSVSRVGVSDAGTNAQRIRAFLKNVSSTR